MFEQCFSCGIKHKGVECIGIFHCPNALCLGCGGGWFRQRLDSYEDSEDGYHTVDEGEWLEKGRTYNKENGIRRSRFYRLSKGNKA